MARQARQFLDGGIYHLWAIGQPHLVLFREPEDYAVYLKAFTEAKRRTGLQLHHYCLLRNAMHLVVRLPTAGALSPTLHQTHVTFRWHHRKQYQTAGPLWRDRFHYALVASEDLLTIGQRVESLPVRDGLTAHPADYPYSSYAHYAFGRSDPALDPHPQYLALAPTVHRRQEQYWHLTTMEHMQYLQPTDVSSGRSPHA